MSALQQLSESRAAAVRSIPLEEAVARLHHLAKRCEISHSNLVLRLIHELEGGSVADGGMPSSLTLLLPLGHHGYQKHVADWQRGSRFTLCGVDCSSWRPTGRMTPASAPGNDALCRRCRRSVELALEDGDRPGE